MTRGVAGVEVSASAIREDYSRPVRARCYVCRQEVLQGQPCIRWLLSHNRWRVIHEFCEPKDK
jgi:hypothetical protein